MKKFLSIILSILMVVTMLPMAGATFTPTATGGCDGSHSGYTAISERTTINKAGNYYLTGDVSANGAYYSLKIYCSGTVTLCLNGYDIYQAGTASVVVDIVATGGNLTVNLCDCKGTGEIYRNNRSYGGIYLKGDSSNGYYATLNMYGGTIRYCSPGVNAKANARFNMYEGTIKDSLYYGVFQDSSDGKVNIYGGTITGNLEGIRVCSADGVTLTGSPVIKDNTNGDLYIRIKNSTVIAENLSVSSPITIAQDSAAAGDFAVVKVDSADMINSFKYINDTKTLVYFDGQIYLHGDSHTFKDATCVAPKTCIACGVTEGDIDPTAHSWANLDGICANGCGATCAHENQTGLACEICGADIHLCSYTNGFCTECDAYEPAELKDGYYQIKNGGNLFWYANYINTVDRTANAVLVADIDLENRPWTPIGSTGENSNNFRGIFDGQNYTIRGLYVEGGRAGLGFFGEVRTGTVKNFTIYGEVVANTEVDYIGGVIGSVCGVNGENDLERNGAIIQNITSYVNLTAKAHGIGKIGGFVGYANHQCLIENCSWYGTFDAGKYRVDSGAGGFIGKIQENTSEVTIRNCGAYGTIKTNYAGDYNNTATIYMGGFLSFSNTNAQTTLENCLFAGKFERGENLTDEAFLGAFGTLRSVKAIKNCYYLGDDGLEAVHSDSNLKPGSDNVEIINVTEEQLKSGEVAYKLQEANEIWGQSIGTDAYPVLGGEEVYCGYTACDDEAMVYTNDSTVSATKPDHAWGEGVLTRPTKTQDGYYTYTCSVCGETKTEPVERAANYDEYEKALNDLRAYLDSDMLTDENKGYISEWLATYDTDEVFSFIAGEEETVQMYIDATAYYASEFEAAIADCLAGNHSGNGDYCEVCGAYIHTCDFSGEWKYDADKHWKECTCGLLSEEGTHSGGEATCTEKAVCETCGESYGEVDADNHDIVIDEAVAPDCVNTGLTEGEHCTRCDYKVAQEVVPALKHKDTLVQVDEQAPTCTEIGWDAYEYCTACDYTTYVEKEALDHDIIIDEAVAPKCNETGLTAGQHCSRCDAMTIIQEVVPALNHKDTLVQVEAKAKTCTEAGYEAYEYCTACDYTTYKEIPASHNIVNVDAKAATCTEAGYEAYEYCTACDYTTYKEIPASHNIVNVDAKAATCTEAGHEAYEYCTECDYTTYKEIPATKHTEETVKGYAATCTKAGLTDGVKCSACGETLTAQKAIAKLAHKDSNGDYKCDYGCGHEFEKPAEPKPDTPDEPSDGDCGHLCHKTGFMGFIWKIVRFFWKLFKMNPVCECGKAHY